MLQRLWGAFRSPRRRGAAPEDPRHHDPAPGSGPSTRVPDEERADPHAERGRWPYLLLVPALAVLALAAFLLHGASDAVTPAVQSWIDRVAQRSSLGGTESGGGLPLPLCARERGELSVLESPAGGTAVAADRVGNFTLYGKPGDGGLPTEESYELLRDCAPGLAPLNYAAIDLRDGPKLLREGRPQDPKVESGSVSRAFAFDGGLIVEQELRFRGEELYVSYTARNSGTEPKKVSIRSTMTPPAATGGAAFEVPSLSRVPPARSGGAEIRVERNLLGERVAPFRVPRRGVPADSTGVWGPGTGRVPNRVTFAGTMELTREPFLYDIRLDWPLPEAVSFAVYWQDLEVAPGEGVTVTHHYGPEQPPARRG